MYSIYDRKTELYLPPFIALNQGDATRQVLNMLMGSENMLSKFPDDYDLYEVGSFNDDIGAMVGKANNSHVCNLRTLQRSIYEKQAQKHDNMYDDKEMSEKIKEAKESNVYKNAKRIADAKQKG